MQNWEKQYQRTHWFAVSSNSKYQRLSQISSRTYPCLIDADVESIDQVFQEHADEPEVEPADAPGAVHQDHDVCDGLGAAHKAIH